MELFLLLTSTLVLLQACNRQKEPSFEELKRKDWKYMAPGIFYTITDNDTLSAFKYPSLQLSSSGIEDDPQEQVIAEKLLRKINTGLNGILTAHIPNSKAGYLRIFPREILTRGSTLLLYMNENYDSANFKTDGMQLHNLPALVGVNFIPSKKNIHPSIIEIEINTATLSRHEFNLIIEDFLRKELLGIKEIKVMADIGEGFEDGQQFFFRYSRK